MPPRPRTAWLALGLVLVVGGACGTRKSGGDVVEVRHVDRIVTPTSTMPLAGPRCRAEGGAPRSSCVCRSSPRDEEAEPPAEGTKRFEIRMTAEGGEATLEAPGLGRVTMAGAQEACFYVDLPAGSRADWRFTGRAIAVDSGFSPVVRVAEYGPAGPYWYDVLAITCAGTYGKCDRKGAEEWKEGLRDRKRGRIDPCGSAVVTGLGWETSGGLAERDGGNFRDLLVSFTMEIKKFSTQFAPGSTECVPK